MDSNGHVSLANRFFSAVLHSKDLLYSGVVVVL
jgi:hypothetical protein